MAVQMNLFEPPQMSHRTVVVGRTGSGKTHYGLWVLGLMNLREQVWTLLDFKRDSLLAETGARPIRLTDTPREPGLYRLSPRPDEQDAVDEWLWRAWEREDNGIFVDEGYMLGKSPAFNAILTQGRSKNVPVIVLSQRPVWLSRFVFSEADFYNVFHLNDQRDRQTVSQFLPGIVRVHEKMPGWGLEKYCNWYYNVGKNFLAQMLPVPEADRIIGGIRSQLEPRKSWV